MMNTDELNTILSAIREHGVTADDSLLDIALDLIIESADDITLADAAVIMSEVHALDLTESGAAAEIRDCIRDNTELDF